MFWRLDFQSSDCACKASVIACCRTDFVKKGRFEGLGAISGPPSGSPWGGPKLAKMLENDPKNPRWPLFFLLLSKEIWGQGRISMRKSRSRRSKRSFRTLPGRFCCQRGSANDLVSHGRDSGSRLLWEAIGRAFATSLRLIQLNGISHFVKPHFFSPPLLRGARFQLLIVEITMIHYQVRGVHRVHVWIL